ASMRSSSATESTVFTLVWRRSGSIASRFCSKMGRSGGVLDRRRGGRLKNHTVPGLTRREWRGFSQRLRRDGRTEGERLSNAAVQGRTAVAAEKRTVAQLYRWACLVRVLVGFLAYALTLYADLPIVEDARFYEEMGYEVAQDWLSGKSVDFDAL